MIKINNQDEMKKYYDKEINTFVFNDVVKFYCDINIKSNIKADYINARDINAHDIDAYNIDARDIDACDIRVNCINARNIKANDIIASNIDSDNISYYSICIARNSLKCKKIEGRSENAIHKCLDNAIEFIEEEE